MYQGLTNGGKVRVLRSTEKVLNGVSSGMKLVLCEDLNWHVGAEADGFVGTKRVSCYWSFLNPCL